MSVGMRTPPPKPTPTRLRRTRPGRYPVFATPDGRFTVTRNRMPAGLDSDDPDNDPGFTIVDTAEGDRLGHDNSARVWELDDATALIDGVYLAEWNAADQRYQDAQARRLVGAS
jgi:hypothetical protein